MIDSMREPRAGAIGPLDKICRGPLVHAVASPGERGKFQHYGHASRVVHDPASWRGGIVPYRPIAAGMLEFARMATPPG